MTAHSKYETSVNMVGFPHLWKERTVTVWEQVGDVKFSNSVAAPSPIGIAGRSHPDP